jgi:hypothetical protein
MAGLVLKKAQRKQAYLKLGMSAPSGGGKTIGALIIAYGLMKEKHPSIPESELWDKIAVLDTENGSGELYVGADVGQLHIGEYSAITVSSPFTAEKYIAGMDMMQEAGIEVCILDSTTHLWSGTGGLLERQTDAVKRNNGNSYTAWREVTPLHNLFVEKMLQCHMHVIATMRSKTEYVQEKDPLTGKTVIKKLGLNPVQKDGMEFEFTIFFDTDDTHMTRATKDRTSMWADGSYFKIIPDTGKRIMKWLQSSSSEPEKIVAIEPVSHDELFTQQKEELVSLINSATPEVKAKMSAVCKEYDPSGNPNKVKDVAVRAEMIAKLKEIQ